MQKINKTTSAPLAAAFFVLSLAIMPFSLKVVGFTCRLNPSLSAGVDVWNQIAASFGSGHLPMTSAELIALGNLYSNEASDGASEPVDQNSLLAKLDQAAPEQTYRPQLSAVEVEDFEANTPQAKSLKAASHQSHSIKRAGVGSYYREIQASIKRHAEALKAAEVAQRELASHAEQLKALEKPLAAMRFDFVKMWRNIPLNKDVKVFVKVKPVKPAALRLTACDLRAAFGGGANSEAARGETRMRAVESAVTSFENCEL